MKIRSIILIIAAVMCLNVLGEKVKTKAKPAPVTTPTNERTVTTFSNESMIAEDNSYSGYYNPFYCFARGMNNLVSCGSEVPRCMVYNSVKYRWYHFGWFTGIFEGSGLAVCRSLTGCLDLATLGLTKSSVFSKNYPESPWDAVWLPAAPEKSPSETNSM